MFKELLFFFKEKVSKYLFKHDRLCLLSYFELSTSMFISFILFTIFTGSFKANSLTTLSKALFILNPSSSIAINPKCAYHLLPSLPTPFKPPLWIITKAISKLINSTQLKHKIWKYKEYIRWEVIKALPNWDYILSYPITTMFGSNVQTL